MLRFTSSDCPENTEARAKYCGCDFLTARWYVLRKYKMMSTNPKYTLQMSSQ